jgi:hypothetical protein
VHYSDKVTTSYFFCHFSTALKAQRAVNMDCECIGVCYVHKSELSGLECACDRLVTIRGYIPIYKTYVQISSKKHKTYVHFGAIGQSNLPEFMRSSVQI